MSKEISPRRLITALPLATSPPSATQPGLPKTSSVNFQMLPSTDNGRKASRPSVVVRGRFCQALDVVAHLVNRVHYVVSADGSKGTHSFHLLQQHTTHDPRKKVMSYTPGVLQGVLVYLGALLHPKGAVRLADSLRVAQSGNVHLSIHIPMAEPTDEKISALALRTVALVLPCHRHDVERPERLYVYNGWLVGQADEHPEHVPVDTCNDLVAKAVRRLEVCVAALVIDAVVHQDQVRLLQILRETLPVGQHPPRCCSALTPVHNSDGQVELPPPQVRFRNKSFSRPGPGPRACGPVPRSHRAPQHHHNKGLAVEELREHLPQSQAGAIESVWAHRTLQTVTGERA
mmetsp:Transcript_79784/g.185257  ORF Transcript_79784/g.185257 Transcript_79784/m.185257 type:complete len:345 (-) Transcript_79784:182-1216(-)